MKQYEYVTIKGHRFGKIKFDTHREIIDEDVARGFKYAGWIPTKLLALGAIVEIDLIFEKDDEDK